MNRNEDAPEGNTPIDEDEAAELIPTHLSTRAQLDAWEQQNIARAIAWVQRRKQRGDVLTVQFQLELHRRMFDGTWGWAGRFRKTARNIGVDAHQIHEMLSNLLADVELWIAHTTYPVDEIAARFHHRLVWIHPFPNGNGRHGRLAADVLLESLGAHRFTWGSGSLTTTGRLRSDYLGALRKADAGEIANLIAFARA